MYSKMFILSVFVFTFASCASDEGQQLNEYLNTSEKQEKNQDGYEFSDMKNQNDHVAGPTYGTKGCTIEEKEGAKCIISYENDCSRARPCNAWPDDGIAPAAEQIAVILGITPDDVLEDWEGALSRSNIEEYPELSDIIHYYMEWDED